MCVQQRQVYCGAEQTLQCRTPCSASTLAEIEFPDRFVLLSVVLSSNGDSENFLSFYEDLLGKVCLVAVTNVSAFVVLNSLHIWAGDTVLDMLARAHSTYVCISVPRYHVEWMWLPVSHILRY